MKKTFIAILVILLTACASPYIPPESGNIASIEFVNHGSRFIGISFYEKSKNCMNRKTSINIGPSNSGTVNIYAGEELTFQFYQKETVDGRYCIVNLRFTPEIGREYVFNANSEKDYCKWKMAIKEKNTDEMTPIKLNSLEWRRAMFESGSFCSG